MQDSLLDDLTYTIWEQFVNGADDTSLLRPQIADSWKRSRDFRVNPYGKSLAVDKNLLQGLLNDNRRLLEAALPLIKLVNEPIQGTGFVVVLTDRDGRVLDVEGDEEVVDRARQNNFEVCASRSERHAGTNAIALALIENKPIQVAGPEHYNIHHHDWTCSAAPIHDEGGAIVGVINFSGHHLLSHKHTLGMAASLAQAVERQFLVDERTRNLKLSNKNLEAVINSISDGVIAIDATGTITAANLGLGNLLGIDWVHLYGKDIRHVFGSDVSLLKVLRSQQEFTDREDVFTTGSRKVFCITTARQIKNEQNQVMGAVGVIKARKDVHRTVNKIVGAKAIFTFHDIIGNSPQIQRAISLAKAAAVTDTRIILEGESGTGKELFAQSIHNASERRDGPFIAVNCSAIPRELIESELFGYSEGAFTGAKKGGKPGKFELADGGTLFLDEVCSMPLDMQAKLLRVLQQNEFARIGGIETIQTDVRVIAASNQPLETLIDEGHFRADLFYRLGVVVVKIPPLRERPQDIPMLLEYLLQKACSKLRKTVTGWSEEAMPVLCSYGWPGNVRELENYVERAVILVQGQTLRLEHFPKQVLSGGSEPAGQAGEFGALAEIEREAVQKALETHAGNISKASRALGITRNTLYNKIRRYGLQTKKRARADRNPAASTNESLQI